MERKVSLPRAINFTRSEWNSSLPDFLQNLPPLPRNLFPDDKPLEGLLRHDPDRPIGKYFESLDLTSEQQDYVYRTIYYLALPRINGIFPNHEVTLKSARAFVRKGLLDMLDFFRNDPIRRETARRLLGLQTP